MRYSNEPRDRIYVKGYGFLSFAKNMNKSLSNKYGHSSFFKAGWFFAHSVHVGTRQRAPPTKSSVTTGSGSQGLNS